MKPEIKAQWLTALRSGDYQQGQNYLRQGDQYCCLGVLCDLYGKAVGSEWEECGEGYYMLHRDTAALPPKVQEWAGIPGRANPLCLTSLNDNGATFEELANIIEEKL